MYLQTEGNIGKLYGTIWQGDGAYIVNDLSRFFNTQKEVTIHIHTPGGSVFDGNLIFNAIRTAKVKTHIIIDGLAASMGSILMMAADKVSIADNAFIMIHAPSGLVDGTSSDMLKASKLLSSLEKQFISKYITRTGKPESEIKEWLIGDNWFDAEEAKEIGLVDAIVEPIIEDIDLSAMQNMKVAALMDGFEEKYMHTKESPKGETSLNKTSKTSKSNNNSMKLNAKSKQILGLAEDATEEQINEAVARLEGLAEANKKLKQQAAEVMQARIRALIDPAIKDGRILAKEKEEWETLASANIELAESTIAKLQAKKELPIGSGTKGSPATGERADWTFTDWSRKDTKGLLEMKANEPEEYRALAEKSGIKL